MRDDLYEYPADYIGRKTYVSVRGHSRSIPKYKTYRGADGYNYLLPEYGGDWSGIGNVSPFLLPDKPAYVSPMDGSVVEGRAAHREHMKVHGTIEAGDLKIGDLSRGGERSPMPRPAFDILRAMAEYN